jgi:cytochrome c oxidase subunit 4
MSHSKHAAHHPHIIEPKTTGIVLAILLVFTVITVWVAGIDFGYMNIIVAMGIATVKASLVIYFFMHGAHENKIVWMYIIIPFILVAVMIGGIFTDDPFRAKPVPLQFGSAPVVEPAAHEAPAHH